MVIPIHDDDQNDEEFNRVNKPDIMENIANMVDMLNNPTKTADQKYDEII